MHKKRKNEYTSPVNLNFEFSDVFIGSAIEECNINVVSWTRL